MNVSRYIGVFSCLACLMGASITTAEVVPAKRPIQKSEQDKDDKALSPKAIKSQFKKFEKQAIAKIKRKWPDAELSTANAWVDYSDDGLSKRKIDFAGNRIAVTLPYQFDGDRIDYPNMVARLKQDMNEILSYSIAEAIERDPINQALAKAGGESNTGNTIDQQVILSELFSQDQPAAAEVEKLVDRLVANAYIKYKKVAALNTSVRVGNRATYMVDLPKSSIRKRAAKYKPYVKRHAESYELPPQLLYAIIHTESHFNPMARSRIPAYGLMQIVPFTAGRDASKVLFKRSKILSPRYLYNPDRNIQVGTVYLSLLYYKYLANIKNPKTRLYCAIAAYNAGTTNVMKTLTGQAAISRSVDKINQMTDRQVYNKLVKSMPARETRDYLRRVIKRQNLYAQI